MSLELKEKIIELLERDREFRYAVAGLIGLDEILKRLDQHDRKFNEILAVLRDHTSRLDEHDRKFNEILKRMDQHDRKFNEIIGEIRDIGSYLDRFSLTLEEEAREVIAGRLRRMGVDIKLTRLVFPELEIDIYGVVNDLCVVGEASTRIGVGILRSVDEKLIELTRKYPDRVRRRVLKVIYTMWATEDAINEAKRRNIWLLTATEDLTSPNI